MVMRDKQGVGDGGFEIKLNKIKNSNNNNKYNLIIIIKIICEQIFGSIHFI